MNILVTSAGRRGYIIEYFKEALGKDGKVYVGNSDALSSAFYYADEYVITPMIYDEEYIPFLIAYCMKNEIKMVIPLFDIDLLVLAQNKKLFEKCGVSVIVSAESVIRICNDKWSTYQFCKKNNLLTARTYLNIQDAEEGLQENCISFPVIVKPRWGMGSLAVYQAECLEEMKSLYCKCRRDIQNTYLKYESTLDIENSIIIQEKLFGQEFGLDVINDLEGNFCCDIVRKKYAMRAGETDCAVVVKASEIDEFAEKISKSLRHVGNLDVDLFVVKNKIYLLEMNARFGGGYPFSHLAGINLPKAIIKWKKGQKVENELKIQKYDVVIHKDIRFVNLNKFVEG